MLMCFFFFGSDPYQILTDSDILPTQKRRKRFVVFKMYMGFFWMVDL